MRIVQVQFVFCGHFPHANTAKKLD